MKLIVGLGNPGNDYAQTRHNIGFMVLDAMARALNADAWQRKFHGELAEVRLGGEKFLLLKPMTYMNLSGQAVGEACRYYKIPVEDVVVFHDELDLVPAKLRVKKGGGHAGHNGLKSIIAHLDENFWRIRLGIGHPGDKKLVSNYVLGRFAKADDAWLSPLFKAIADNADLLVREDLKPFQAEVSAALNDALQRMEKAVEASKDIKSAPAPFAPLREPSEKQEKSLSPFEKLKGLLKRD